MPDEPPVIESPPPASEPKTDPNSNLPENFGNLGQELDRVFRSTGSSAQPKPTPEPVSPAETTPPAQSAQPAATPAPASIDDGLLPTDLFGGDVTPPPAAPSPREEIPIPEGLTKPKDIATWKELRHRLDAAEGELPKAKAQADEWKAKYETAAPELLQAKLAETEKVNKEMSERIAVVDLQLHPEFQRQFIAPRAGLVQNAVELIKESDIEPEQFDQAMKLSGKARRQALDEIIQSVESPTLTGQLGVIFNQIEDLDRRKSGALADARGNWERLQEHDKSVRYEVRQQEIKQLSNVIDQIDKEFAEDHGIVFFKKSVSNEKWNQDVEAEHKAAVELATNCRDQTQICKALRLGAAFPRVYNWALTIHKENQKLKAENSELKGADPSLNGMRTTPPTSESSATKGLSFAEAAARGSGLA